jgi:nitrite reductase (NADH) small subunit
MTDPGITTARVPDVPAPAPYEDWQPVCRLVELEVDRGATALVHGQALAVFRTHDDGVFALGNHDPFAAHASGLARGIVGVRGDVPFVASPTHKRAFDLRTGRCLDDEHVSVPVYEVRVVEGVVLVGHRRA